MCALWHVVFQLDNMLVTYPFKRGERYRQNPCQKRQSTKKKYFMYFILKYLIHNTRWLWKFNLNWIGVIWMIVQPKRFPTLFIPTMLSKYWKIILNLHSFVIMCKYLKKIILLFNVITLLVVIFYNVWLSFNYMSRSHKSQTTLRNGN